MHNAYLITEHGSEPVTHALTLEAMQRTVNGLITPAFTIDSPEGKHRSITGYCNDEGILLDLEPTTILTHDADTAQEDATTIHGPLLIVALNKETGETAGLTAAELAQVERQTQLIACIGFIHTNDPTKKIIQHCLHEIKLS
jgi:hypothetical protein